MRANLFVYRDLRDPWLRKMREAPRGHVAGDDAAASKLTGNFEVTGDIKIRPADLYVTTGYRQPGIVLVGDAFATSCPAAGTGVGKVFTDVGAPLQRSYSALARHRRHGRRKDRGLLR